MADVPVTLVPSHDLDHLYNLHDCITVLLRLVIQHNHGNHRIFKYF